jgi:hypothetical protein
MEDGQMHFEIEKPNMEMLAEAVIHSVCCQFSPEQLSELEKDLNAAYGSRVWLTSQGPDDRVFALMTECWLRGRGLWPVQRVASESLGSVLLKMDAIDTGKHEVLDVITPVDPDPS